jgi:hypothetical protein
VADMRSLTRFKNNLEKGMEYCQEIAASDSYDTENLESIVIAVNEQKDRLNSIFTIFEEKAMVAG